ncbi:MAG: tetratricopeptide repeat protein [Treponema sp.]|jgi:tetratricopeptide (TPR) repeat protein|nr:tetratricopeptide repeat protein [Treponema sp.]
MAGKAEVEICNMNGMYLFLKLRFLPRLLPLLPLISFPFLSCVSDAISAEEYFAIGMAYFDMGKYAEAEAWLIKARSAKKTVTASDYNLGRIAFETKRYEEAARYFERVLAKDPNNVQALKAVAYTRIKTGELDKAEAYYSRTLEMAPESADSGYNYALVLYALKKYDKAEEILAQHPVALRENKDSLLLYARVQKAQSKPEAVDSYALWLAANDDPQARYEYGVCLEYTRLYALALETYRAAYEAMPADNKNPTKPEARFAIARVSLIADSDNDEGIAELEGAIMDGFTDFDAVALLLTEDGVSEARKADIQRVIDNPPSRTSEAPAVAEESDAAEHVTEQSPESAAGEAAAAPVNDAEPSQKTP